MDPTLWTLAKIRHDELLKEAELQRRAKAAQPAAPQRLQSRLIRMLSFALPLVLLVAWVLVKP